MKSIQELHAICEMVIANRLPREQILFMNWKEKMETDRFLKNLGSSGVNSVRFPNTEIQCDKITYGGVTFYILETGWHDQETISHDWIENKTFFRDNDGINTDDKYILSRYCKHCGKTETFHGTRDKWIETGYIKVCEKPTQ